MNKMKPAAQLIKPNHTCPALPVTFDSRLHSCTQVSPGDAVEARVGGTLHVLGRVTEVLPMMELFWVVTPDGSRRIVELSEFDVYLAA